MKLQLIRSATLRLSFAGRTYLIDPWLAAKGEGPSYAGRRRSPLVDLPFPVEEVLRGVDAVLVSHLHSDHFDTAAHAALNADVPLICAARDAEAIGRLGFGNVTGIRSELRDGEARIALTSGRHGPPEVLEAMGEVSGFVFRAQGEPTLYWAGDTIFCDEVCEVLASRPEVVVVHACGAEWDGVAPLVMDEAMVEAVLRAAPEAQVVATHLDAVDHATVGRASLRAHFEGREDLLRRLHVPADGDTLSFDAQAYGAGGSRVSI